MSRRRKELFSEKVPAGRRTYFFDVKEAADGAKYLVISESKQVGEESFEHKRVMVFREHLTAFNDGFNKAVEFMMRKSEHEGYNFVEQIRRRYPRAYERWTKKDDFRLRKEHIQGKSIHELAESFQRGLGAIRSRLEKLGLA